MTTWSMPSWEERTLIEKMCDAVLAPDVPDRARMDAIGSGLCLAAYLGKRLEPYVAGPVLWDVIECGVDVPISRRVADPEYGEDEDDVEEWVAVAVEERLERTGMSYADQSAALPVMVGVWRVTLDYMERRADGWTPPPPR